jgi:serine/threonine protein kinase
LAWDPELRTHRAIKIPHSELIKSGRINAESFVSEARKLAQLGKHPGIVSVTDVQRMENGLPFVVSEFVSGGSLADKTHGTRMPWREAVALVAEIADAVAHAHTRGIVHRDLKPANILLTDESKPVVADFGLALSDDEHSYRSTVCGTYQYMSPQQVSGQADRVDGRADIYSLGVILYQLVAGRVPYKSRDVQSLKREILSDEPAPLRQYAPAAPVRLQEICQRAMAKSLESRYSTATDFAADLRALLKGPETPEVKPAAAAAKGIRWWTIAAAVAGCGLFVWALFTAFPSASSAPSPAPTPVELPPPSMEVHFQKADRDTFDPSLSDSDLLPMGVGDKFQFHVAELAQPMFAYVYSIDSDGTPNRFWPEPSTELSQQTPVEQLSIPAGAGGDAVVQPWLEIGSVSGPLIFFVGLSDTMLNEKQLAEFEQQAKPMTDTLLGALNRSGKPVAEFEYPERGEEYVVRDNEIYKQRGAEFRLVVAPKSYSTDHSRLQKWFQAYRGWIVTTSGAAGGPPGPSGVEDDPAR